MSAGFRKSFLGFNCDDVTEYIETSQRKFSRRESELEAQLALLKEQQLALEEKIEQKNRENAALSDEISNYRNRCDEIEQLSESIGKLYLVSQNSAKNIVNNSVASSKLANKEIFKNIDSIDTAHDALADIKSDLIETTNGFVSKISELCASLADTKTALIERGADSDRQLEEFTSMFNKINNAE